MYSGICIFVTTINRKRGHEFAREQGEVYGRNDVIIISNK